MVFDRKCMSRKANKQESEVCLQFMPEKIASNPHRAKWRFCIRAIMKNRTCCSYILSLEFPDCFNLQMIYSYGTPKFRVCYNISLKKPQDNCAIETIVRNFGKRQKYHQRVQVIFLLQTNRPTREFPFLSWFLFPSSDFSHQTVNFRMIKALQTQVVCFLKSGSGTCSHFCWDNCT